MPVFILTDIENSTRLWEQYPKEMRNALARHDEILKAVVAGHGGRLIKHTGDGIFAVFENNNALLCALEIQKEIHAERWTGSPGLRVRVAAHAGPAEAWDGDYFGPTVNRTARILSAGWGSQILATPEAAACSGIPDHGSLKDLGFHLLKDLAEPEQIFQLIHPDLPLVDFPPLRSLSNHPNNLPPQPTPFLPRQTELREISRILDEPSSRLLTLIGPGGTGKTRLALQYAADRVESFPHGAYLVPLAPLTLGDFIPTTVASSLNFSFYGDADVRAELFRYLGEKEMLLVLDNFEHLIRWSGFVGDLLLNASRLKVLVTSRERLHLKAEKTLSIQGMDAHTAVQFFIERARGMNPDFSPVETDRTDISEICRLVDGIPLGIELAATWTRLLTCREILEEIRKNLDFLTSSFLDTPDRHKSLRAVFDYSWNFLSAGEKDALTRLSIFHGGFSRDAAEKVAGATLPILSSLLDKSLIRRGGENRYEILEVLRQFSEEKLREKPGERSAALERHARYYTAFLEESKHRLRGSEQKEAVRSLEGAIENIRLAWHWAVENQSDDLMEKSLSSLYHFYFLKGWSREAEEAFRKAAEKRGKTPASGEDALLARLLLRQGDFSLKLGLHERAREALDKSFSISNRLGLRQESAYCLHKFGTLAELQGDYQTAKDLYEKSLGISIDIEDKDGISKSMSSLSFVAHHLGRYSEAWDLLQHSLSIRKAMGDHHGIAGCLNNLGVMAQEMGHYREARKLYEESLLFKREINDLYGIASGLGNLGWLMCALRDFSEAARLTRECLGIRKEIGDRNGIADCHVILGRAALGLNEPGEAESHFLEALRIAAGGRLFPLALDALLGMARVYRERGMVEKALTLVVGSLEQPALRKDSRVEAEQLRDALISLLSVESVAEAIREARSKKIDAVMGELLAQAG